MYFFRCKSALDITWLQGKELVAFTLLEDLMWQSFDLKEQRVIKEDTYQTL